MCLERDFRVQLGVLAGWQVAVLFRHWQRVRVQFALRETLDGRTGVAEQDAASAMAVEQLADQAGAGLAVAIADCSQQGFALGTQETLDGGVGLG
ncbi:hypothetical protein D3C78_1721310 [compost metagenome]